MLQSAVPITLTSGQNADVLMSVTVGELLIATLLIVVITQLFFIIFLMLQKRE